MLRRGHQVFSQRRSHVAVERYCAPESVAEAVALLASGDRAAALAGGTDLLVQMRGASVPEPWVYQAARCTSYQPNCWASQTTTGASVTISSSPSTATSPRA